MTIVRDDNTSSDALAIVEKYETFMRYLYPILQRAPRQHGILRDVALNALFAPIGGLYQAAKSKQVSRLYAVDAEFATLRAHLRFMAAPALKIINRHQHAEALKLLAEPGGMLNAWIRKLKRDSGASARGSGQASETESLRRGQVGT